MTSDQTPLAGPEGALGVSRDQAKTLVKVAGILLSSLFVTAGALLWIEWATLANTIPDDHITAAVGRLLIEEPWLVWGGSVLFMGFVIGAGFLVVGHIGEAAKKWAK